MKIAFVSFPGMKVGGVAAYVYRLSQGFMKLGHDVRLVMISKGRSVVSVRAYMASGMSDGEYEIVGADAGIELLNSMDLVVYEQACGYGDYRFYKNSGDASKIPWYYRVVANVTNPVVVAILHTYLTYTTHSPYLHVFEDVCDAFVSSRLSVAKDYIARGGRKCVAIVNTPISIDGIDPSGFLDRQQLIVTTSRIDPIKRYRHLVNGVGGLNGWGIRIHSGENVWYEYDRICNMISNAGHRNIGVFADSKAIDLDSVYEDAALTYVATRYPRSTYGGMESATLEAVVRGVVPILSPEWVEPNDMAVPLDACYPIEIYDERGDSNLREVVSNIKVNGNDYNARRRRCFDFVAENFADTVVARQLVEDLFE